MHDSFFSSLYLVVTKDTFAARGNDGRAPTVDLSDSVLATGILGDFFSGLSFCTSDFPGVKTRAIRSCFFCR